MEQNLNKHNPSFVGIINTVCDRFQNLIENVKVCNELSNKKQQYIRTIKRWHNPSYLGEFREVLTRASLLSHQNFLSVKTTEPI
jgi:hypothetical protein